MTDSLTLIDMVTEAHDTALEKGWWNDKEAVNIPEKLALIHSEVSEALEAYRTGDMKISHDKDGKPDGFPVELADVLIRIADLCGYLNIDLEYAVLLKMAHNKTRSFRHGGKRA